MEDDDEFGDLYTDVLNPFASTQATPPPAQKTKEQPSQQPPSSGLEPFRCPIDLNLKISDQERITPSALTNRILAPASVQGADEVGLASSTPRVSLPPFSAEFSKSSFQNAKQGISPFQESEVADMDSDVKFDIEEADAGPDDDPLITGVSNSRQSNGGDDWDSDSEDELQIVLNENPPQIGMFGDEDDDEDEQLVIVGDEVLNQTAEGTEWREHGGELGQDRERKESGGAEAVKTSGTVAVAPKVGYGGHGYHPFHSQFKYVRPGAAPIPGTGGATIQTHPPTNMGPVIGRGRGEWRPAGRGGPPFQKGYHAGPAWGSGRGFNGGGLDFSLPSHKTIFEVDIDSFEEKPWKHPGIDLTDFFNFGLNEESWKDYSKQLDQRRLETTMQNRIRVHEGVRTEQAFDPDMPPELAAAAGVQNVPAEKSNVGMPMPDAIQTESRAAPRPPVTIGRPIPVEAGSGERLPSTETRQIRIREPDSVIEIDCGAFFEDNSSKKQEIPDAGSPADDMDGDCKSEKETIHEDNNNDTSPEIHHESSLGEKKSEGSFESMDKKSVDCESSLEHKIVESIPAETGKEGLDLDTGPVEDDEEIQSESKEKHDDLDDREDSRAARSSENSKARSGSSKLRDGNEDEVTGGTHRDRNDRRDHEKTQETRRAHPAMKPEGLDRRKVRAEDTRKRDRDRTDDVGPRHRSRGQESERPYGYPESKNQQKRERGRDSSDEYYSTKNGDDIPMHRNEKPKNRAVLSEPRDSSLRTDDKPRSNYHSKETLRHEENPKHRERSRQVRVSSHGDHRSSNVSDKQKTRERERRESARRSREPEDGDSSAAGSRRNQRDHSAAGLASSDDEQSNSRRGRSKLERWASHKERDFTANIKSSKPNGRPKDYAKAVDPVPEDKDPETGLIPPENRHLDAVERLKKRSERFKLPLPVEKETQVVKTDVLPSAKTEASAETESKHERPPRKRRWVSS